MNMFYEQVYEHALEITKADDLKSELVLAKMDLVHFPLAQRGTIPIC